MTSNPQLARVFQADHALPRSVVGDALAKLIGLDAESKIPTCLEVSGAASSGKSTVALHLCLASLREGEAAGWIDSGQGFYPLAAAEAGEPLDRFLVVRVPDGDQAMKAADLLLSCTGAVAVAVVSLPPRYRPAEMALLRLHRLAEKSSALIIFLDERPAHAPSLGVPVALRLKVQRSGGNGTETGWPLHVEVIRNKAGSCGPIQEQLNHEPNRLRLHRTL